MDRHFRTVERTEMKRSEAGLHAGRDAVRRSPQGARALLIPKASAAALTAAAAAADWRTGSARRPRRARPGSSLGPSRLGEECFAQAAGEDLH